MNTLCDYLLEQIGEYMKKISIICAIVVSILIFGGYTYEASADVSVEESIVETLAASGTKQTVSISGEFADNGAVVFAVAVQVRDLTGNVLAMESAAVYDRSFSLTISDASLSAGTTYEVYAADYAGGAWKSTSFTVPSDPAPINPGPSGPSGGSDVVPEEPDSKEDEQTGEEVKAPETEKKVETQEDGTKITTINTVTEDGAEVHEKIVENTDGTKVTEKIVENTDGTVVETVTEQGKNESGKKYTDETVVEKDAEGNVVSETQTVVIPKAAANTSVEIAVVKDGDGNVTSSEAQVVKTVKSDKPATVTIPAAVTKQITDAVDTPNVAIKLTVKNEEGKKICSVKINSKIVKPGATVYLIKYDKKTKSYVKFSAKGVKIGKDGKISVKNLDGGTYRLVTKKTFNKKADGKVKTKNK